MIKRFLGCALLVLTPDYVFAKGPTTLAEVNTIILRSDSSAEVAGLIRIELESRLPKIGINVTEEESLADAELVILGTDTQRWHVSAYGGGSHHQLTSGVRVRSLPSHELLFSFTSDVSNDELSDACVSAAKKIVKKLDAAIKE